MIKRIAKPSTRRRSINETTKLVGVHSITAHEEFSQLIESLFLGAKGNSNLDEKLIGYMTLSESMMRVFLRRSNFHQRVLNNWLYIEQVLQYLA
jgi:hypothetical protein